MDEHTRQTPHLRRALGLRDLVYLNVACIVSLATLAQVAQLGFSSLTLYILAIFTFLIPCGLVVAELNARMPEEGGFYLWTREAFGELHGYLAAWCYWVCNIVWFATAILLVTLPALYLAGDRLLQWSDSLWYNGSLGIGVIWLITLLNIWGMDKAKWIQNVGGIAIWITTLLLLVLGLIHLYRSGPSQTFTWTKLIPDLTNWETLPYIALVPFCFGGLELAPVLAGEVKEPRRNIPRAILIASLVVGLVYLLGTLMLLLIIPAGEVALIEGIAQALYLASTAIELPWLGIVGAALVVFSTLGLLGGWMTGNARIPFVIGLDHYLPAAFARVHPRYGTPVVSLILQAALVTILFMIGNAGATIEEAFLVLLDMSIILYFLPFLYLFAAFIVHIRRGNGRGLFPFFKRLPILVWVVGSAGLLTTLTALVLSAIPTGVVASRGMFVLKVVGGAVLLIAVGMVQYIRKHGRGKMDFTSANHHNH